MPPSQYFDPARLQLAYVEAVNYTTGVCTLSFQRINDTTTNTLLSQPYAGRGWGIFAGVEVGTIVLVSVDRNEKIWILAYVPDNIYYRNDLDTIPTVSISEFPYPPVQSGEIALQSKKHAIIALNSIGDVTLSDATGDSIDLDSTTNTFSVVSAQNEITTEAANIVIGIVKRDIRSAADKAAAPLVGSSSAFGFNIDPNDEIIGFDPTAVPNPTGINDDSLVNGEQAGNVATTIQSATASDSTPSPGTIDLRAGQTGPFNFQLDTANPGVTEYSIDFYEFGDSNVGFETAQVNPTAQAQGKFNDNVLGRFRLGTVVNSLGKTVRFDYGFNDGNMGHGSMWNTPAATEGPSVHASGETSDGNFDATNTLANPQPGIAELFEWTVDSLLLTDAATMFDFTLRTRGADYDGAFEPEDAGGPNWFLRIDKQGLTKLNIPAASTLDGTQPWREGRSLIANFDGSFEVTFGRQYCTTTQGLDRITGSTASSNFVNMNNAPNYCRKDRSITLDLEGNLELFVGAEQNSLQSIIVQTDGSFSGFFGKENPVDATTGQFAPLAGSSGNPISTACLATTRIDRSWTVRMIGNAEFHIGQDAVKQQSLMMTTDGGNRLTMGADYRTRSLDLHTVGGVRLEVQGPMTDRGKYGGVQGYALEFDLSGNCHLYIDGAIEVHSTGDMRLHSEGDFYHQVDGDYNMDVQGNHSINIGQSRKIKIGTNDSLDVGANRDTKVGADDALSAGGEATIKASTTIAFDGGMLLLNSQIAQDANPQSPDKPQTIFNSAQEQVPIPVSGVDDSTITGTTRTVPLVSPPPQVMILDETIDQTLNRLIPPTE